MEFYTDEAKAAVGKQLKTADAMKGRVMRGLASDYSGRMTIGFEDGSFALFTVRGSDDDGWVEFNDHDVWLLELPQLAELGLITRELAELESRKYNEWVYQQAQERREQQERAAYEQLKAKFEGK